MLFVFRADASHIIGTGHIMRCITLAEALRKKNAEIVFICRNFEGNLCDMIEKKGFAVCRLDAPDEDGMVSPTGTYAHWLGVSWEVDAAQTLAIIQKLGKKPDWLVADHYAIDLAWESALRLSVDRIFVIDDLADRDHNCDILLDQNYLANMGKRYNTRVPKNAVCLLGPEYALLQPDYSVLHNQVPPRKGIVKCILTYYGGSDLDNLTAQTIEAFILLNRPDVHMDVVISRSCPHYLDIKHRVANQKNITLYDSLPTLAPLIAGADLGVGASGSTIWERLCLGLPSVVVTVAENQREIAQHLQNEGLIIWLGDKNKINQNILYKALIDLTVRELDGTWSERCMEVVDGKGVQRICTILTVTPGCRLHARQVAPSDESLLLKWANDPDTRRQSFSQDPISQETHHIWFNNCLKNTEICRIYIIETDDGIPLGQVRFDFRDSSWEIDYSVAPLFRRRGLARFVLNEALTTFRSLIPPTRFIGRVKMENLNSRGVFESLGFLQFQGDDDVVVYTMNSGLSS